MAATYAVERATPAARVTLIISAVVLVLLIAAPWWAGRADLRLLIEIFYYLALAQMWNLLAGYAGLVSVGQQAYVGLGGYMLFALAALGGVPPLLALPLAGVIAAIVAIPTAFVAFRLRGAYFAIGTWVIAEVFRLVFAQMTVLGGGSGMSLPATIVRSISADRAMRESLVYWIALVIGVTSIVLVYFLLRSRWGLALTAIRDSEPASESLGVETYRTKFLVYVVVAGMTGLIGALIFLQKLRISPEAAFNVNDWTAFVIFIVVIGGIGTIEGP
ncbi:MAG: branched-chain amino acid ABC transporter permease, partial [Pseudomonadota bacterium]